MATCLLTTESFAYVSNAIAGSRCKHVYGMGPHQRSRTLVVGYEGFLIHICIANTCVCLSLCAV
jgi:hypothetical protein